MRFDLIRRYAWPLPSFLRLQPLLPRHKTYTLALGRHCLTVTLTIPFNCPIAATRPRFTGDEAGGQVTGTLLGAAIVGEGFAVAGVGVCVAGHRPFGSVACGLGARVSVAEGIGPVGFPVIPFDHISGAKGGGVQRRVGLDGSLAEAGAQEQGGFCEGELHG
jgi:hypothetical protein